jgi:hypothetical protein
MLLNQLKQNTVAGPEPETLGLTDGLIFAYAGVPADQFAAEEALIREMVESVIFSEPTAQNRQPETRQSGTAGAWRKAS